MNSETHTDRKTEEDRMDISERTYQEICNGVTRMGVTGTALAGRLETGARMAQSVLAEQRYNDLMEWAYAERMRDDGRTHQLTW